MLQIKTIKCQDPDRFDYKVNNALADGWTLTRRLTGPTDFVAELEMNIITEDEKCCGNCKHLNNEPYIGPCALCNGDKWEAAE